MGQSYFDDVDDDVGYVDEIEDVAEVEDRRLNKRNDKKDSKKPAKNSKRVKQERAEKYKPKKRKKAFSGQTALGLGCIGVALLIFFVVGPMMTGVIGNQVEISRVSTEVLPGDKITEKNIETVSVNRGSVPEGAVIKKDEIVNKFSDSKLVPGDFFMKSKLKDSEFGDGVYMNGLDGTKRILSIAVPGFAEGISAKVKAGDIITVSAKPEDGSLVAEVYPELKYIKVLATTASSGVDSADSASDTKKKAELPATMTLLVNDVQAKLLIGLNSVNRVHVILTYRGAEDKANAFLAEQDQYFVKK